MKNLNVLLIFTLFVAAVFTTSCTNEAQLPVKEGLILDLNANQGISLEQDSMVTCWTNQVPNAKAVDFKMTEEGRTEVIIKQTELGTGRPTLKKNNADLNNYNSLSFRSDELINDNDEAFHGLITGKGYTWFAIVKPYQQVGGPANKPKSRYPHAFFGCLRNSKIPQFEDGVYAGFWGSFYLDGRVYMGSRNGTSLTIRDGVNTPEVEGPILPLDTWHIVMGRQGAGTGTVMLDLFVDNPSEPFKSKKYPVADIEPSRMAIGTERNAINHQGGESFDGELARILMYEGELSQEQMEEVYNYLRTIYFN